jgi:hypothetical protein
MEKATPIKKIRQEVPTDPSAQFAENPGSQKPFNPLDVPVPSGQGQGQSQFKENFTQIPDKLIILVFVILLLFTSTPFVTMVASVPKLGSDGHLSIIGTVVISIIGAVLFQLIRYVL